ncbi:hypothetical protein TeGR_g13291, partial [Tetraparma gracilis]
MPTTTRAQWDDGAETLCPPGSGNYAPPCACDVIGWVDGESMTHVTGAIGCSEELEGSLFCYVQYDCNAVGVEMTGVGVKWRYCEENEPEPVECQPCPPGTASSDTSALPCTTCPIMTYANVDEGATLCAECPDDTPWTEEGATSLEECEEKPPSFMMAFDSIACENVARMVGRWDPVERTASGRWWYRHEDWRGEDGGLKSLYWDPDASGVGEVPSRWMFDSEEPSLTASRDLVRVDGSSYGYKSSLAFLPPKGSWNFYCEALVLGTIWLVTDVNFEMFTSPDLYNSASSSFDCVSCEDGGHAPVGSTSASECLYNLKLYAYDYSGALIKTIDTPSGIVKGMAIKPGLCPELTSLLPPAAASTVERIHMPVMLRDRYGDAMPDSFDAASVASDIFASARGEVQSVDESLALPHTVGGIVEVGESGGGLQAVFEVTFSGEWVFELSAPALVSEVVLEVEPGPTAAASCRTTFPPSVAAGKTFVATLTTYDVHDNPTRHTEDEFKATAGEEDSSTFARDDVTPADPEAAFSTHNIGLKKQDVNSFKETSLDLTLTPMDRFENVVVDATDVTVSINGGEPIQLTSPLFTHSHVIPARYSGDLVVSFKLDGEDVANSPVTISVAPTDTLYVVGVVFSVLLILGLAWFYYYKQASQNKLVAEKNMLEEEVRRKKHSEDELKVMVEALQSVSKERQDELKEVMIDSMELQIDKLLGKGGFGVVNLGNYRGIKVAVKQLLTVNEENVLRFRHECFLMKNLSHPNVVQLVGVCWSEELFACCLEFAENGSLEDWLRQTAGGKVYRRAKTPVIGKRKLKDEGPSLADVTFKGFNHNGEYDEAEHTDTDRAKKEEGEKLLHHWWMQRMNPKMGWTEMLNEDGSRLDHGMSGYHVYDKESKFGNAMAHCYVNATPAQVAGCFSDRRENASSRMEFLDTTYTTETGVVQIPIPVPTISDRESLFRGSKFWSQDNSFVYVAYTIEDERRPVEGGKVRIEALTCTVVREAPGTEGEGSECWRMTRFNFKFGVGLGFINSLTATKTAELIVAPIEQLKLDVERLLKEYKPPEHRVEELELTWKGGLWRMALEAALGVQYLHHHRYWSDGGKRHNGATNEVEEEEAGWKESVIHRDLKPDNMLLTRDWTLKLTDFGEARAQNMGGTMTSVGTPIYIAPEVMRADHYDAKADTWSFGLCLVAMIRAERTLEQFFYQ